MKATEKTGAKRVIEGIMSRCTWHRTHSFTFLRTHSHSLAAGGGLNFKHLFFFLQTNTSVWQQPHRSNKTTLQDSAGELYVLFIYYNPGTLQGEEMRRLWNLFQRKGDIKTESRNVQNSERGGKLYKQSGTLRSPKSLVALLSLLSHVRSESEQPLIVCSSHALSLGEKKFPYIAQVFLIHLPTFAWQTCMTTIPLRTNALWGRKAQ